MSTVKKKNSPMRVITLGKWSGAIFLDGEGRFSVNIRRNIPREEIERMEQEEGFHPESILLFEEETLIISELATLCSQFIGEEKLRRK